MPNVVKTNWAREVELWTPSARVTVIHGDGEDVDAFGDVVIVNYEVLDRHVGWLGGLGFKGMVVDEAHYIKNQKSQRSQNVLALAERIRAARSRRPLLMALTGTPLINDIEDFRAIWQVLGWIEERKPGQELMAALEETGLHAGRPRRSIPRPAQAVIDMGIVRRKKVDVAADIPARRIADIPVELEGDVGRSIREAEQQLAERLVGRYRRRSSPASRRLVPARTDRPRARAPGGRARGPRRRSAKTGDNVFTMVRKIGQAKAELAADYAVQLARERGQGRVLRQAHRRHGHRGGDLRQAGVARVSIRGDQTRTRAAERHRRLRQRPRRPGRRSAR